ncbi:hypothetical protein JQ616_19955 [Bradyrhizobium tropiciagri]|uniref:hypothetical protein n=1 Tax=Bradyrhizobium tropiciagri TaxID=312253 RepID=UPI001BA6D7E2|nr:hypothetical protein [Bradyrhizobium tropiciagri]MBR0897236.1 hypothetical protein [Bradyrhizobium tropiciagri]
MNDPNAYADQYQAMGQGTSSAGSSSGSSSSGSSGQSAGGGGADDGSGGSGGMSGSAGSGASGSGAGSSSGGTGGGASGSGSSGGGGSGGGTSAGGGTNGGTGQQAGGGDGSSGSGASGGGTSGGGGSGSGTSAGGGTDGGTSGGGTSAGGGTSSGGGSGSGGLPGLGNGLVLAGQDGLLQPVLNPINAAASNAGGLLTTIGHQAGLDSTVGDVTGLAGTVGLGQLGAAPAADGHSNLLTDLLNTPGEVLSGHTSDAVANLGTDLTDTVNAIGAIPAGLGQNSGLTLAGQGGLLQPVLNAVNGAASDASGLLTTIGHEAGLDNLVHDVTNLAGTVGLGQLGAAPATDGHSNLVTDLLNTPSEVLAGHTTDAVTHLGADLTDTVHALDAVPANLLTGVVNGQDDPANPIDNLIQNVGHDLQSLPLVTANGGNNANDGGLLGGIVGSLSNPNSGHLVTLDVGPTQPNGQAIDILAAPTSGDHHTVEVNAVDVGANGPHLLDLGALTGSNSPLSIPSLGGTGTDGLVGNLLGGLNLSHALSGNIASGNTTSAPIDVDAVVHDLIPITGDHGILNSHGAHIL